MDRPKASRTCSSKVAGRSAQWAVPARDLFQASGASRPIHPGSLPEEISGDLLFQYRGRSCKGTAPAFFRANTAVLNWLEPEAGRTGAPKNSNESAGSGLGNKDERPIESSRRRRR